MNKQDKFTVEQLRSWIKYDPETGFFSWRIPRHKVTPGSRAGGMWNKGYRGITVDGAKYYEHRLAWFYVYGIWPKEIDHINLNKTDNRIANLREAPTRTHQNGNWRPRGAGLKGVGRSNSKSKPWAARIGYHGKNLYLGLYKTPEEAHAAYVEAANKLFGEFARAA